MPDKVKKISAALYDDTGKILFFVGKTYYRYMRVYCYLEEIKMKEDKINFFILTNGNVFKAMTQTTGRWIRVTLNWWKRDSKI